MPLYISLSIINDIVVDNLNAAGIGALSLYLLNGGRLALGVLLEGLEIVVAHKSVVNVLGCYSDLGNVFAVCDSVIDCSIHSSLSVSLGVIKLVVSSEVVAGLLCAGRRIVKLDRAAASEQSAYVVVGDVMYPGIGNEEELVLDIA